MLLSCKYRNQLKQHSNDKVDLQPRRSASWFDFLFAWCHTWIQENIFVEFGYAENKSWRVTIALHFGISLRHGRVYAIIGLHLEND